MTQDYNTLNLTEKKRVTSVAAESDSKIKSLNHILPDSGSFVKEVISVEDQLILDNIGLAYRMVKILPYYSIPPDERLSIAFLGLVEAARIYDETRGVRFTTFAYSVIKNMMINELDRTCKHQSAYSLDKAIDIEGEELTLMDLIRDEEAGYVEVELSDLTGENAEFT